MKPREKALDYFLKRDSVFRDALEKIANIKNVSYDFDYEEIASDMKEIANKALKGVAP